MSPEAAPALAQSLARSAALRTAFGAVLGFLLAGVFRLDFFFLPPLLAVQILALMRRPPSLAQGAGLFFMIAVLSFVTLLVSGAFARQPLV